MVTPMREKCRLVAAKSMAFGRKLILAEEAWQPEHAAFKTKIGITIGLFKRASAGGRPQGKAGRR
jgi:hypothetical protein